MIIEGDSDIITRCEWLPEVARQQLTFRNGNVLVLSESVMAFYKSAAAIDDPLGNGLLDMVDLPEALSANEQGFVVSYRAGFVGLADDKALLITPNDIQLFPNKECALRNQQEIARLALAG